MNDISGIKKELDEITNTISNTVPVEEIYLFGSYAYGTPHKNSDLDLYIVFKNEMSMAIIDAIHLIRTALNPIKTKPIDFLGLRKDRFQYKKNYTTIEKKIAREGIKLYG